MSRCLLVLAIVFASTRVSQVSAEGISFTLPESTPGSPYTSGSSFSTPSPFATATPSASATTTTVLPAPPASLLAPPIKPINSSRTGSVGTITSDASRLTNPLDHLAGTASSVLASPDRYDSGVASRLSVLPAASSTTLPQFHVPMAGFGSDGASPPMSGALRPNFAPSASPQVYFGTR